ncbi:hypothetical protein HYU12_05015 [Candidatus Woesearchaeota archaeon]|nr:hypothetical protein [Candidatus Woesearchaeota archaeon]
MKCWGGIIVKEAILNANISDTERLKQSFTMAFASIKDELDEHRESINDNTNELHANYEYMARIDDKLRKISERIEQIEAITARITGMPITDNEQTSIRLTETEKKIFLLLYTEAEKQATYETIACYLGEELPIVKEYITTMIEKGVPIRKRFCSGGTCLDIEPEFKEKQAKENILRISQTTVMKFLQ